MPFRPPSGLPVLLLPAMATAFAGNPVVPPPWPAQDEPPVTLTADPVRPLLLGSLRVALDRVTLADARQAIGAGAVQRGGGGTDALDWLCYTVPDGGAPERLWLTASELSRGRIDAVVAVELPAGSAAGPACPELPPRFRPVRFDDGLWLGGLSTELRRTIGIPAKVGARFSSLFQGQAGGLRQVSSTVLELRGGRAVGLFVAHSAQR